MVIVVNLKASKIKSRRVCVCVCGAGGGGGGVSCSIHGKWVEYVNSIPHLETPILSYLQKHYLLYLGLICEYTFPLNLYTYIYAYRKETENEKDNPV